MQTPLLSTKLTIPFSHTELVHLPRLHEKLNESLISRHSLTYISAPAGFGKTTLVVSWQDTIKRDFAWLSLDSDDNDMPRFLLYLIAALQKLDKKIGLMAKSVLESSQIPPIKMIMTSIINDIINLDADYILVIDNYHKITNTEINAAFQFLIQSHIPLLHIVLISREVPSLPLAQLRAKGLLTDITVSDLRFQVDEVKTFLEKASHLKFSDHQIKLLTERTEGWISGVQLAAVSLQYETKTEQFIHGFSGRDSFVIDFLVEEIFEKLDKEIQTFLVKTSILKSFNHQLCDCVVFENENAGKSREILSYLEKKNLFINPLDNRRQWYRYDSLFADLLQHQLVLNIPDGVPGLHSKAGIWYENNGFFDEAIQHFLKADDFQKAANIIEKHAINKFLNHGLQIPLELIEALPEEMIANHPVLSAVHAFVSLSYSPRSVTIIQRRLMDAERLIKEKWGEYDDSTRVLIEVQIAMLRVELARASHKNHQKTIELLQKALVLSSEQELPHQSMFKNYLGELYLETGNVAAAFEVFEDSRYLARKYGQIFIEIDSIGLKIRILRIQGRFKEAEIMCRDTLETIVEPLESDHLFPYSSIIYSNLSLIQLEKNNMPEAVAAMEKACKRIDLTNYAPQIIETHINLAYIQHLLQKSSSDIQRYLENIITRFPEARNIIETYLALFALQKGDIVTMERYLKEKFINPQLEAPGLDRYETRLYYEQIVLVHIAIKLAEQGKAVDFSPALQLIDKWKKAYKSNAWNGNLLGLLLLKTMICDIQGDSDTAFRCLKSACKLGQSGGYISSFIELGPRMFKLLQRFRNYFEFPIYIDTLINAFPKRNSDSAISPSGPVPKKIEKLSKRELEILLLIAQGLSSKEIGEKLFITSGTVNVHTNNIFNKLKVDKRTKAVAVASKLGLLTE
ncbi:MAG: hypothetical protein HOD92_21350 [Deltaproteobacteria bacterium]|nr:hypothetical protein [Deltaproteobacteria bacterium]